MKEVGKIYKLDDDYLFEIDGVNFKVSSGIILSIMKESKGSFIEDTALLQKIEKLKYKRRIEKSLTEFDTKPFVIYKDFGFWGYKGENINYIQAVDLLNTRDRLIIDVKKEDLELNVGLSNFWNKVRESELLDLIEKRKIELHKGLKKYLDSLEN